MSAIIENTARIEKAESFIENIIKDVANHSVYMGLSRVLAWSGEPTPDVPDGSSDEEWGFFHQAFALKKITSANAKYLVDDPTAYNVSEVDSYVWLTVADASAYNDEETVTGTGGATGTIKERLSGGSMIGKTNELVVLPISGTFLQGDTLTGGVSLEAQTLLLAPLTRTPFRTTYWKEIPYTHLHLVFGPSNPALTNDLTEIAIGDTIEDTVDSGVTGLVIWKEQYEIVGADDTTRYFFLTVVPLTGDWTTADIVIESSAGVTGYPIKYQRPRIYADGANFVYMTATFGITFPVDMDFRQVGILQDPAVGGVLATSSEYSDPGPSNHGQNNWYLETAFDESGKLIYLDNRTLVTRVTDQSEIISAIIEF